MSKITKSARMEDCQVRQPGICNYMPETVVFAHINGAGIAMKHRDLFGAYACSNCHKWLDGGYAYTGHTREYRDLTHFQAMMRTQDILLDKGLVKL